MVSSHQPSLFSPETADVLQFERRLHRNGLHAVAGIDEAGRGPLAGPVVAAAVVFPPGFQPDPRITDSKKTSEKLRDVLFDIICASAAQYAIARVDADIIDQINISQATRRAMLAAVTQLSITPDHLLIDGISTINSPLPQTTIIQGDSRSITIAAASILAKVYRDRLMEQYHREYPLYGFDRHKGYGSAQHREALKAHGPCPIHRISFRGVILDTVG